MWYIFQIKVSFQSFSVTQIIMISDQSKHMTRFYHITHIGNLRVENHCHVYKKCEVAQCSSPTRKGNLTRFTSLFYLIYWLSTMSILSSIFICLATFCSLLICCYYHDHVNHLINHEHISLWAMRLRTLVSIY